MTETFVTNLKKYISKEDFDSQSILEDLELDIADYSGTYDVVFENDDYQVCKPNCQDGLIPLSEGTRWLAKINSWNTNRKVGYDDIDYSSYVLRNWDYYYVILDKHNPKKKWMFMKGYGDIYVPSFARYSCATWVAENGNQDMWEWFIKQKFPFISTNLEKKVGHLIIQDKTVFIYPDDSNLSSRSRRKSQITEIQFAPGVTKIKANAFSGLSHVTEVTIPEGVTTIGNYAFYNCSSLATIHLPSTLKTIGSNPFDGCPLTELNLPDSVKKIGSGLLSGTNIIKLPKLPPKIDYIPEYCFGYRYSWSLVVRSVGNIEIPAQVKVIKAGAFQNLNIESKTLIIPDTITEIGEQAFGYGSLEYVYIPKSVTKIDKMAFGDTYNENPHTNLVIECEATEKPEGWNEYWNSCGRASGNWNRRTSDWEYRYYYYPVRWGVAQPSRQPVNEDLDLDAVEYPGVLSEEQCDKFLDLLSSLPEMSKNNKEEFLRICKEWLLNIWMEGDYPSQARLDSYFDTLTNPDIIHIPVFWAKTENNGGKNYIIARFDDEGFADYLDNPGGWESKHGNIQPHPSICVSTNFLKDFLGIDTNTLAEDLDEDLELDVQDNFPPVYADQYWAIYRPKSLEDFEVMADGTNWYEKRNTNDHTDWHFTYYENPPYYIFENRATGDKYLYTTRDSSSSALVDSESNRWKDAQGHSRYGQKQLESFLSEQENANGIIKWCLRKWPQGLKKLNVEIKSKELLAREGTTVTYKSEFYERLKHTDNWWNRSIENSVLEKAKASITAVKFPRNIQSLENGAFADYSALQEVNIPNTIKHIGASAFVNCKKLTSVSLPSRLETIGELAFYNCDLKDGSIIIPISCKEIGANAFKYNGNLVTIYCEASEKPEGWDDKWDVNSEEYGYNSITHRGETTYNKYNVIWGYRG